MSINNVVLILLITFPSTSMLNINITNKFG